MKERQLIETNRKACLLGIMTIVVGSILGVMEMFFQDAALPLLKYRLIGDAILVITYIVMYNIQKRKKIFMYTGSIILIASYMLQVFITNNTYMYAYMYPVALYVMLYMDTLFTIFCACACAFFNVLVCYVNISRTGETFENLGQLFFALTACFIVCAVVRIQNRHRNEQMKEIDDNIERSGDVSRKIMGLSNDLAEKFAEAQEKADMMTRSMSESNNAVEEISKSVHLTANAVEQQTSLTTDIQENIESANEETESMKQASAASVEAVEQGISIMKELGKQAELTGVLNRESSETTEKLNNRINAVEDILGEILNISSQTNLLALNASVEAARAGEAGKGFAVVAGEIRMLSEQTKDSANKITEIIAKLVEDAAEASGNMKKSISASELQNEMISNTIEQINTIKDKNDVLYNAMQRLSAKMSEILQANQQIGDSILNLSAMSEEVASNSTSSVKVMEKSMDDMQVLQALLNQVNEIAREMKSIG